jgi:3D-(3,5/4)-trihydroxycyclohexane-1,2-dione acylhydrolase (decyclizing)
VLQQLEHPVSADVSVNDCFRPVSRFFDRISRPEQLLTALPEAMRVLTDPAETGAVTLALPQDVQAHAYDYPAHFFQRRLWRVERRPPDPQRILEAVGMLREAQRPVIIAGGGVHYSEAWDELQALAEACGIPVGETLAGKGALRKKSALSLGGSGVIGTTCAGKILNQADLVIGIGTRLTDFTTGSQSAFQSPRVRFININVCGHDAYKQGAVPILADAREVLRALAKEAKAAGVKPNAAYVQEVERVRQEWATLKEETCRPVPGEAMSQAQVIQALNEQAQPGDTVIAAAGSPPGDLNKLWDAQGGAVCHLEFGFSCMGYELPAGLGVRMAQPKGEVYVFIGDGTYLLNPTELVTALQENWKITVILSENHGFQSIWQLQQGRAGRSFGNEFRARDAQSNRLEGEYLALDLAANAASLGARAWHVTRPDDLGRALAEARQEKRPCVIVAATEPHRYVPGAGVWWDVAAAEVTHDPVTQKLYAAFDADRKALQRLYY